MGHGRQRGGIRGAERSADPVQALSRVGQQGFQQVACEGDLAMRDLAEPLAPEHDRHHGGSFKTHRRITVLRAEKTWEVAPEIASLARRITYDTDYAAATRVAHWRGSGVRVARFLDPAPFSKLPRTG
jgi:hypothetical protein